jgi:hypothetical protein
MAAIAAGSTTPFSCGAVSFVIVKDLVCGGDNSRVLSEFIWSEHQSVRRLEIHRHGTTSSVAAPVLVTEAELAPWIGLASSGVRTKHL